MAHTDEDNRDPAPMEVGLLVAYAYPERIAHIVISLDTVRTNAEKFGKQYDDELHRVIIHGILHLCGINDKGPGEREIMEDAENKALAMLQNLC